MSYRPSIFLLSVAGVLVTPALLAQAPLESPATQDSQPSPEKEHLSPSVSQAVREKLPAYDATEKKPEPVPERTSDAVVLEKMIIRGAKPRVFTDRDLATKSELNALLGRRYPGSMAPLSSHMPNYGRLMLADEERLEYIAQLDSVAEDLQAVGDLKASKELKKEISRSFMRRTDWQTESLDRSANNNRR